MTTRPLWREVSRLFCDRFATSVDTELIHPDSHHYSDNGHFFCQDSGSQGRCDLRRCASFAPDAEGDDSSHADDAQGDLSRLVLSLGRLKVGGELQPGDQ